MPDRYKLTELTTTAYSGSRSTARDTTDVELPVIALREWLGMNKGEYLSIAPKTERSVVIGPQTPPTLSKVRIGFDPDDKAVRGKLDQKTVRYLGIEPGDELTFRKRGESEVVITA